MRHVSVMSFMASIGLVSLFAVDFIDMIFISMLGESALAAAVGYSSVILFFTISVSIGFAITTGALVARALGQRDVERARLFATHSLTVGFIISVALAVCVWIYVSEVLDLIGAGGETKSQAIRYMRIIVPSLPVLVLAMAGAAILRAHGDASRAMWTTLIGGIVNAVLDPFFIFTLDLKLDGAALASVAARFAIFGAAFWPIFKHYGGLAWPRFGALASDMGAIFGIAVPAVLTNIATPIGQAYVIKSMAQFGDDAVAGMAIIGRLTPVAFGVVFALSGAIGPIVGQNFGAKKFDRVNETLKAGLRFTLYCVLAISTLLYFSRDAIANLFSADGQALMLIYLFCGPLALVFFFNGALFVSNAAFNNLNRPFYSTMLNWARHTLGTIPFVMVGAWAYGAAGVLIGQAVGGVLFGSAAIWVAFRLIGAYEDGRIDPDAPRRRILRWPFPVNPFNPTRGG
jgi:putative MATE family efflux protein